MRKPLEPELRLAMRFTVLAYQLCDHFGTRGITVSLTHLSDCFRDPALRKKDRDGKFESVFLWLAYRVFPRGITRKDGEDSILTSKTNDFLDENSDLFAELELVHK